ncbi:MAG: hypothetical protein D6785_12230 [Planctomycetota bacterium]|nr:MAG: hypothetical protein D6785_12230 [Planctomycetota bacterium]
MENLTKYSHNPIGMASAFSLVIKAMLGEVDKQKLHSLLKKCSKIIRKGAAYAYWYFVKEYPQYFTGTRNLSIQKQIRILKEGLDIYPEDPLLYSELGEKYFNLKDFNKVKEICNQALKCSFKAPEVLKRITGLYKKAGYPSLAKKTIELWIQKYPNHYLSYYEMAKLLPPGPKKDLYFRLALIGLENPTSAKAIEHKYEIMNYYGFEKEAWKVLNQGVADNGATPLYVLLVEELIKKGEYQKALAIMQKISTISRKLSPDNKFLRARIYLKLKSYKKAFEDLKDCYQRLNGRKRMESFIYIGVCLENLGYLKKAENFYRYTLGVYKNKGEPYGSIASYYQRRGKYTLALEYLKKAPRNSPFYPKILALISLNYALLGREEKAVEYISLALDQGFKDLVWLKEQYGYSKAYQLAGFRMKIRLLEE